MKNYFFFTVASIHNGMDPEVDVLPLSTFKCSHLLDFLKELIDDPPPTYVEFLLVIEIIEEYNFWYYSSNSMHLKE